MRSFKPVAFDLFRRFDVALTSPVTMPDFVVRWRKRHPVAATTLRILVVPSLVGYCLATYGGWPCVSIFTLSLASIGWLIFGAARAKELARPKRFAERVLMLAVFWLVIAVAILQPHPPDRDIGYLEYERVPLRVIASDLEERVQRCNIYVPPEASGELVTLRSGRSLSLREAAELVAAKSGLECVIKQCPVRGSIAHGGLYSVTFYRLESKDGN